jgi:predicted Zn-dependent protease
MARRIPLLAFILLSFVACATNPVTGKKQLALITEAQEMQMGKEASVQVAQQMGLVNDPELQNYVDSVGRQLAAKSERPHLQWEFRVVDDPMINAFALPGGYIFLTRGILAHFNNEAEMVSVLGHEIGHVTARHSVEQMSKQQLASLGLGIAMILSPQAAQYGDLAGAGLQLMFLKFGRDDERQADDLGLRYMIQGGWDADQMPPVFDVISATSRQTEGGRVPEWASTHPDPDRRAERLREQIAAAGAHSGTINAESYLRRLGGMVYGANPREGYTIGSTFIHPDLGFRMQFPDGWKVQNSRQAVVAVSPNQDAMVGLSLAPASDPGTAARTFFSQQGVQAGNQLDENTYTFQTAQTQQGVPGYAGIVSFVRQNNTVLQLIGYTTGNNFDRFASTLRNAVGSFTRENNPRYLDVQPKRIEVVRLPRTMTIEEFAREYPSTVDLPALALLNGVVREGGRLEAGSYAKRVTGMDVPRR